MNKIHRKKKHAQELWRRGFSLSQISKQLGLSPMQIVVATEYLAKPHWLIAPWFIILLVSAIIIGLAASIWKSSVYMLAATVALVVVATILCTAIDNARKFWRR